MPRRTAMGRFATRAAAQLTRSHGRGARGMLLAVAVLALIPAADGLAAGVHAHAASTVTLFGSRALGRSVAHQPANRAEAFSYSARSSGTASSVGLYVQSRARATRLRVAVYSNARGRPGVLLTAGSALRPRVRAWNRIGVRGAHLVAGHRYWLVVLPTRGKVALRYRRTRACADADRRRLRMTNLPTHWRSRAAWQGCQVSAYVSGVSRAAPPTGGSGPTPPGSPSPPNPPSPPAPQTKSCFSTPSACGYPDQTNTGVPAGTPLTTLNGDQQINAPGTYTGWNVVNGSIRVNASNVTIKDSLVTNSDPTGNDILIPSGVSNVTIEDTTLRGTAANNALQYSVQNASDASSITGLRLDMYNCTECWSGSGTLQDSYAISNGVISGSHYEDIYYGGGGGALVVNHDTLLNPQDQTAAIFTKTDFGNVGTVTVTNNLLAGGGYTMYGGLPGTAGGGSGSVVGPVTVTGNRFARCLSCGGGGDSHGYFVHGGSYSYGADFNNAVTTWSGNYWDDNLAAVARP